MPYISVIVTEYFKRGLLREALESVFSQKYTDFEVIVSKREEDKEIDDFIRKHSGKIIYDSTSKLGERVFNAAQEAKGEVIALLEDDDRWTENRLAIISKIFKSRNIAGFRNLRYIINEDSKIIRKDKPISNTDEILTPVNYKHNKYMHYLDNNSSIVIKKDIIDENMKKIELALDIYLAITSICSEKFEGYYLSREHLTYYRLYSQNLSIGGNLNKRINFSLRNFMDFQFMYEKYIKCPPEVVKTIKSYLLGHKLQLSIYSLFPESNLPRVRLTTEDKIFLLLHDNTLEKKVKLLLLNLPLKRKLFKKIYNI